MHGSKLIPDFLKPVEQAQPISPMYNIQGPLFQKHHEPEPMSESVAHSRNASVDANAAEESNVEQPEHEHTSYVRNSTLAAQLKYEQRKNSVVSDVPSDDKPRSRRSSAWHWVIDPITDKKGDRRHVDVLY